LAAERRGEGTGGIATAGEGRFALSVKIRNMWHRSLHENGPKGQTVLKTLAEGDMLTPWYNVDGTLFATVASRRGGGRYHLLAERLPGDGWDWTAWRTGASPGDARHGCAPSAEAAMAAAGGAVRYWDDSAYPVP
jgi:hypothetical protein